MNESYRVTELQSYRVTRGVTRVTRVTVTDVISLFTIRPTSKRCIHLLSPKRWSPNVPQPTLQVRAEGACTLCRTARRKTKVKAKFAGSPLVVGKTDAVALLLREKVSVF